jgi:peptide/nickel transport system ATP-binding protein
MLQAKGLAQTYRPRRALFGDGHAVHAVNGVSLELRPNRTLALVGESGSGKSTTARLLLGLETPSRGSVTYRGQAMPKLGSRAWRELRQHLQLVYQNPRAALDPRVTITEAVHEPLQIHTELTAAERSLRVAFALQSVGLGLDQSTKLPRELSGGQVQRAVLARALVTEPEVLVCDEPVSALDLSIQAQVIGTLIELQKRMKLAILFISHDLRLVRQVADEVAVMYLGRIVEQGPTEQVLHAPRHPYTQALISATPAIGARGIPRIVLPGDPPDPARPPSGCAFHPRCPIAIERCRSERPELRNLGAATVACHLAGDAI